MASRNTVPDSLLARAAVLRPLASIAALSVAAACSHAPPPAPPAAAIRVEVQATTTPPPYAGPTSTTLVFMGTTDTHGRILPYDYYTQHTVDYGLARLKPLIDSVRTANRGRSYLFDSGDILQGNPFGFVYARVYPNRPNPIIRAMNLLRYTASAVGNHEYNYGLEHLGRAMQQARFPFVAANIFKHGTNDHAYAPYVLIPHVVAAGDTILIGVTGNTPPGVMAWDKANVEGKLQFRGVAESLKPVVAEMRAKGADVVVVLSHGGLTGSSYDPVTTGLPPENESARVAREVPGVDIIFLGHTHEERADTTINGVLITQAKNWARSVAVATFALERDAQNTWHVANRHAVLLRARAQLADTAFIDSLRWEHERTVEYVSSVVGTSTKAMSARESRVRDTPIIDFINEVQRRTAASELSATAAFSLESMLPKGDLTIANLAGLYVYDNTLKAVRINGAQLRAYLEKSAEYYNGWPAPAGSTATNFNVPGYNFDVISGVDYTIDLSKPVGQRITRLEFKGAPVRAEQTFTLALNNYRQTGGGGFSMLAGAPVVYDRQQDIRELLIDEVRRRRTIIPGDYFRENWRLVPAEAATGVLAEQSRKELTAAAASQSKPGSKRLRVLTTTDFHGRLLPEQPAFARGRDVGGAAALAAYIARERKGFDGPTVLLDGGDVMQGTPVSNLTEGRSAVEFFNYVQYRAAAIGNHDFDWSVRVLRDRIRQSRFAWLSANIFVAGSDTAPAWVKQTALFDVTGVKVGVIGLSTEATPTTTKAGNVRGLRFGDGAVAMDKWVPALRKRGADFVIVVAHSGAVCDTAGACEGEILEWAKRVHNKPDLIVAGHTHRVVQQRANGIPIVEAASYSERYGVVDLERVGPDSVKVWIRGTPATYNDAVTPDSVVAAMVARYVKEIGPRVNEVIATLGDTLRRGGGEFPLGRLIADAQRAAGKAQLAVMNNGGIRADLVPGAQTWGTLFSLQPFQNRLMRLEITGANVKKTLENGVRGKSLTINVSGITASYDLTKPPGQRVSDVRLSTGEPVRDDGVYSVAITDFLAGQGDSFTSFANPVSSTDLGIIDLDALLAYLRHRPQPVRAPTDVRLRELK